MCYLYEREVDGLRILKFEKYKEISMKTCLKRLFTSLGSSGASGPLPATKFLDLHRALKEGKNPLLSHPGIVSRLKKKL